MEDGNALVGAAGSRAQCVLVAQLEPLPILYQAAVLLPKAEHLDPGRQLDGDRHPTISKGKGGSQREAVHLAPLTTRAEQVAKAEGKGMLVGLEQRRGVGRREPWMVDEHPQPCAI